MSSRPTQRERLKITKAARKRAFKKRNIVRCRYCGKGLTRQTATGDHVQPVSKGGANKQKNIVVACRDCNTRKGSIEPGTFLAMIRADGSYMAKRKGDPKLRKTT